MNTTFSIIGGDNRIIKLSQMLKKEGHKIKTFGLEDANEIIEKEKYNTIEKCVENCEFIISAIPFSKDYENINMPYSKLKISIEECMNKIKGKKLIAGSINETIQNKYKEVKIYDLLRDEELTIANANTTAEGAIQIAMEETLTTIYNSKVLILGFGRIGKILAKDLKALGAKVTCEARKDSDIAWIKAYGYSPLKLEELDKKLDEYEIIFNTIPYLILDKNRLEKINKECVIIDLASKPGGVDFEECNKMGIKNKLALALPGKVAPITSAQYIKDAIYKIVKEV